MLGVRNHAHTALSDSKHQSALSHIRVCTVPLPHPLARAPPFFTPRYEGVRYAIVNVTSAGDQTKPWSITAFRRVCQVSASQCMSGTVAANLMQPLLVVCRCPPLFPHSTLMFPDG